MNTFVTMAVRLLFELVQNKFGMYVFDLNPTRLLNRLDCQVQTAISGVV